MSLYKLIVFTGPKGAGKSSLIKSLFPELDVRFEEPSYYRDYMLTGGLAVREVAGRRDAIEVIMAAIAKWNINVGLLVVDSSRPLEGVAEPRFLAVIERAEKKALVANKVDEQGSQVAELEKFALEKGLEFFGVSTKTGLGIEELKKWIITGEKIVKTMPKPVPPPVPKPPLPIDLVPVVAKKTPDKSRLTQEELEVLELCDGKRSISEIAMKTGKSYGEIKKMIDKLMSLGFLETLKPKIT